MRYLGTLERARMVRMTNEARFTAKPMPGDNPFQERLAKLLCHQRQQAQGQEYFHVYQRSVQQ